MRALRSHIQLLQDLHKYILGKGTPYGRWLSSKCNKGIPKCNKVRPPRSTNCKKAYEGCDSKLKYKPKVKHGGFGSCKTGRCGTTKNN